MIMLLRSRSREVYRLYSEGEFLDGPADGFPDATAHEAHEAREVAQRIIRTSADAGQHRINKLAGPAVLAGAMAVVGGVIVANSTRLAGRDPDRRAKSVASAPLQDVLRSRAAAHSFTRTFPQFALHSGSAGRPHTATHELAFGGAKVAAATHPPNGGLPERQRIDVWQPQAGRTDRTPALGSALAGPSTVTHVSADDLDGPGGQRDGEFGFEH